MSITRSEQIRQLAYKCAVLAIQAADRITKARFEQEEQDWLSLAEKAEKADKPKRASMGRPYLRLEMTERRIPRVKRARERTELKNPLLVQKIALVVQKLALRSI